jgi:putative transposase
MKYKKWSLEEKLEILSFSEEIGIVSTCSKFSVSTGTFYSWKKKHESHGQAVLSLGRPIQERFSGCYLH